MIYIKRFCFCIVMFLSVVFGIVGTLVFLLSSPIWGLIYYTFSGNDPFDDELCESVWNLTIHFMEWYDERFGPE